MEDKTMNKTSSLITLGSAVAVATLWLVGTGGPSIGQTDAVLEEVANPFGGTRAQWEVLAGDGGVQKHNRWHSLPVTKANVRFDTTGKVIEIAISTDQTLATAREIREPINKICGFKETDWDVTTSGNFLSGSAENSRCKASYLPEDNKYWTYSIKRQARVAT
jgi:hypothetical protein